MYFTLFARGEVVKPLSGLDIMCNITVYGCWRKILRWTVQRRRGQPSYLRREWICVPLHHPGKQNSLKKIVQWKHWYLCWEFIIHSLVSETQSDLFWATLPQHEKANTARLPDISFFKFQAFLISNQLLICWFAALMQLGKVTFTAAIV